MGSWRAHLPTLLLAERTGINGAVEDLRAVGVPSARALQLSRISGELDQAIDAGGHRTPHGSVPRRGRIAPT
jgi:hypothetical protein